MNRSIISPAHPAGPRDREARGEETRHAVRAVSSCRCATVVGAARAFELSAALQGEDLL